MTDTQKQQIEKKFRPSETVKGQKEGWKKLVKKSKHSEQLNCSFSFTTNLKYFEGKCSCVFWRTFDKT